jgi:hypothetical protein
VIPVDPNRHDRFFVKQRVRPIVNQYEVSTLGPNRIVLALAVGMDALQAR